MRAFGPVMEGPFYRYSGSLTTPPCTETVKWFIFQKTLPMSASQWLAFKDIYPNPGNNRPIQPLHDRKVMINSFEEGVPKDYDFFLNRAMARDRRRPDSRMIVIPVIGTIPLAVS